MKTLLSLVLLFTANPGLAAAPAEAVAVMSGKKVYDYFCYQCHAYAGDAHTLAARFLDPPPRDFTKADPRVLTRERMMAAVTDGRPSTGMKSFSRVLDQNSRAAVVDYIRREFMNGTAAPGMYHTEANGWPDHRRKYGRAYPFATGAIATDTLAAELTEDELIGRELFQSSCMSCHDQGIVRDEGAIWRARASSYPRRHYDHRLGPWDAVTSATPYQRHDRVPAMSSQQENVSRGQRIFLDNCAFCHGADGTGKNWIGSFLEPPAADLTGSRLAAYPAADIRNAILMGVPGSTMPAWRGLLDSSQMDDLVAYLNTNVLGTGTAGNAGEEKTTINRLAFPQKPAWNRRQK